MTIFDEVSKAVLKSLGIVPPLPDHEEWDPYDLPYEHTLGVISGPEPEGEVELVRRYDDPAGIAPAYGYAYVCKACDVMGAVAGGEEKRCWSCRGTGIEAR